METSQHPCPKGLSQDFCEKIDPEELRRFSERVLHDMNDAVVVADCKGNIVYANDRASRLLEVESGKLRKRYENFEGSDYNDRFFGAILDAFYRKEDTTVEQVPFMAKSGKKYVFLLSSSYLPGETEDDALLVITIDDRTDVEQAKQKLNDSSRTFTTFLFAFCFWMLFYALWEYLKRPFSPDWMTHGVEVLGIAMLLFILRYTSLTWHDLGITTDKPVETVRTALIIAVCAFAFLCLVKAVTRLIVPGAFQPEAPFIDFSRFGLRQILYIFTAAIQEFLARSVVQGNLRRIVVSRHPDVLAIVLSSMIFAGLHIHLGFLFMFGAAVLAGLEGILYEKQRNLLGVWIVHWAFGVSATLLCLIDH